VNDPDDVPPAMVREWELLAKSYFVEHNMSLDSAKNLAYDILKNNWQITDVNGDEEYMKDAPELYYNKRGLDPKWIREQLVEDVTGLIGDTGDFFITPDPNTQSSTQPGYLVTYFNDRGKPLPLTDSDGNLLRWRPDVSSSKSAQDQITKASKDAKVKRLFKSRKRPSTLEEMQSLQKELELIEAEYK
jgi:hypothetical protein